MAIDLNRHISKKDIQMASRFMERYSASLVIREMHIKTTMFLKPPSSKTGCYQKYKTQKCREAGGDKGILAHYWWECKLVQSWRKTVWRFLKKKLQMELLYDTAIPLLGVYPRKILKLKRQLHFCVYCSTIHNSQEWKQPKCPSTDDWRKKMCDIYTTECYSAIKKKRMKSCHLK